MCLAVPMRIISRQGLIANCEAKGVQRDVNLFLLQDQALQRGDFVLVHVGYAIQRLDSTHARQTLTLLEDLDSVEKTE